MILFNNSGLAFGQITIPKEFPKEYNRMDWHYFQAELPTLKVIELFGGGEW